MIFHEEREACRTAVSAPPDTDKRVNVLVWDHGRRGREDQILGKCTCGTWLRVGAKGACQCTCPLPPVSTLSRR